MYCRTLGPTLQGCHDGHGLSLVKVGLVVDNCRDLYIINVKGPIFFHFGIWVAPAETFFSQKTDGAQSRIWGDHYALDLDVNGQTIQF